MPDNADTSPRQAISSGPERQNAAGQSDGVEDLQDTDETVEKGALCCVRDGWGLKLSPFVLLLVFVYCNLLNYIDRGIVNGVLPKYCVNCVDRIQASACNASRSCSWENGGTCGFNPDVRPQVGIGGSFGINETAQGVLAGAFMGGYCVFSPLIALLSTLYPPFSLMGVGLSVWVLAAGLGATAGSFEGMVAARVLSGVGEASFQCLAPCFIDDSAPHNVKGKWLAAFFMAVPIGQALGYVVGGVLCSSLSAERLGFAGWRVAFALEAAAMLPVCLLCAFVTNKLRGSQDEEPQPDQPKVCGYGAFTFSLGAAAVWGPYFLQRVFKIPLSEADGLFGGVAVLTGLLGTLSGGLLLDAAATRSSAHPETSSLRLAAALVGLAYPLCIAAFRVESYSWFIGLMFAGQYLAFAAIPTINGVLLWCVPASSRALSMALSVVGIHLLGDVPSPVVVGAMLERLPDPRIVLQLVMAWLGWCLVFWAAASVLSRRRHAALSDLTQPLLGEASV